MAIVGERKKKKTGYKHPMADEPWRDDKEELRRDIEAFGRVAAVKSDPTRFAAVKTHAKAHKAKHAAMKNEAAAMERLGK